MPDSRLQACNVCTFDGLRDAYDASAEIIHLTCKDLDTPFIRGGWWWWSAAVLVGGVGVGRCWVLGGVGNRSAVRLAHSLAFPCDRPCSLADAVQAGIVAHALKFLSPGILDLGLVLTVSHVHPSSKPPNIRLAPLLFLAAMLIGC